MEKSKGAEGVINLEDTTRRRSKMRSPDSAMENPTHSASVPERKGRSNKVRHPNNEEMWFYVARRYARLSISEFYLVTGPRCHGQCDTQMYDSRTSKLKGKYFSQVDNVTHEDIKSTFIYACQMPNLDLVEALLDVAIARMGALYFLTTYLFPRDYKKVVDNYLFALVEDFDAMNRFPWGKLLFYITLGSLKDRLSRKAPHYRLRSMLVAFQVWIYETFPTLDGIIVTRTSKTHPRMMNWMIDEQPSAAKLEGADCFANVDIVIYDTEPSEIETAMPYMNNVQYQKLIQPDLLSESRKKKRTTKSADNASASGKSVK
ncbi:Hypothetical predicted protein [Olea europaea subsp. europaea]|uniref:DUF1985 domain-containing protein n=1 Tax=Olea europaea subsp. europaea TaxID=158383 RepID=A0A8S0V5X2_OLEEU|nr:Hypothetical predicted protein [Olea europaea subsp. europaea]